MYILRERTIKITKGREKYFQMTMWSQSLGGVMVLSTFDITKAQAFETREKAKKFRDDNLNGSWVIIRNANIQVRTIMDFKKMVTRSWELKQPINVKFYQRKFGTKGYILAIEYGDRVLCDVSKAGYVFIRIAKGEQTTHLEKWPKIIDLISMDNNIVEFHSNGGKLVYTFSKQI